MTKNPTHKPLWMPYPWIEPTGWQTPTVLCPASLHTPYSGLSMWIPNGGESKLWWIASEHLDKASLNLGPGRDHKFNFRFAQGKTKGRSSAHGLVLCRIERSHTNKNFATAKHGIDTYIEGLRKPRITNKAGW